jgi:hypothetical protein
MPRLAYAPNASPSAGYQSAYDAGLSYFPDGPAFAPEPLGNWTDLLPAVVGFATGGPAGAAAAQTAAGALLPLLTGSKTDQERQARVNYFLQQALDGNIAAVQVIMGAPEDTAGTEDAMWTRALATVQSSRPDVYQQALALGPVRFTGTGDTATNYPTMKAFTTRWAQSNQPVQSAINTALDAAGNIINRVTGGSSGSSAPTQHTGLSPVVMFGGLAVAVILGSSLLKGKRR